MYQPPKQTGFQTLWFVAPMAPALPGLATATLPAPPPSFVYLTTAQHTAQHTAQQVVNRIHFNYLFSIIFNHFLSKMDHRHKQFLRRLCHLLVSSIQEDLVSLGKACLCLELHNPPPPDKYSCYTGSCLFNDKFRTRSIFT